MKEEGREMEVMTKKSRYNPLQGSVWPDSTYKNSAPAALHRCHVHLNEHDSYRKPFVNNYW